MATAEQALAELTEISAQVEAAALCDRGSGAGASTLPEDRGKRLVSAAKALLQAAEMLRGDGEMTVTQLEVATVEGSVFVVREGDQVAAAVTSPEPTSGLVFYDLKSCLRSVGEAKPKRKSAAKTGATGGPR